MCVVTDTMLAGALHERMHQVLPGIEEVAFEAASRPVAAAVPRAWPETAGRRTGVTSRARDREEEVAGFARRVKAAVRNRRALVARAAPRSSFASRCRTSTSRAR